MFFNRSNGAPEAPPERYWAPLGRTFAPQEGSQLSARDPKTNPRPPKDLLQAPQGAPLRALRSRRDPSDDPKGSTVASRHPHDHPKAAN